MYKIKINYDYIRFELLCTHLYVFGEAIVTNPSPISITSFIRPGLTTQRAATSLPQWNPIAMEKMDKCSTVS